ARQVGRGCSLRAIPPAVVLARAPGRLGRRRAPKRQLGQDRRRTGGLPLTPIAPVSGLRSTRQGRLTASLRDRASPTLAPLRSSLRTGSYRGEGEGWPHQQAVSTQAKED